MKRPKKVLITGLVIVGMFLLIAVGCNPEKGSGNELESKPEFVLTLSHQNPEVSPCHPYGHVVWAKEVEKATDGRVKIDIYPGGTLGEPAEAWDTVVSGMADIVWSHTGYFPGVFPISDLAYLPMMPFEESGVHSSKVFWDFYENYPYLDDEYGEVKLLLLHGHDPTVVGSNMPIRSLEDVDGLKIRTPAGPPMDMMKSLGATVLQMPATDIYLSMETGVMDAYALSWEGIQAFGLDEVTKYYTELGYYTGVFWLAMNKDTWNSLPNDLQEAIESVSGYYAAEIYGADPWDIPRSELKEKIDPDNIFELSDEELERWREAAQPIWDEYVNKLERDGLPGREALDTLLELIEKHR